ncbi:MAG: hypothetical protein V4773_04095 [Verrucomicrobiota bacterium]
MKSILLTLLLTFTATFAIAAEKVVAGPKGGRLLGTAPNRAEFFVTPDRKVEITFYDAALKPVAPGERTLALTAEPKSGKAPIALEKTATGFRSTGPLPAGDPYRVVVQLRETASAKPQNFRVDLNLEHCGECKLSEYACTCDH